MFDLRVVTFGQPRVLIDGQDVVWHASSARDLFFFLLSSPEGRSQGDIATALWPEEEGQSAASSNRFRVALHRMRAAFGDGEAVVREYDRYRLSREVLETSDVYALHAALRDADVAAGPEARRLALQRAVDSYGGEYLPDHRADWASAARAEHKASYVRATLELSMLHCEAAECDLAIRHLAQALRADPLIGENYHQDLMACLASVESKYAAVEHYRRFIKYLRDDLSDTPMPETAMLAGRLKAGELVCPHQIGAHAPCTKHLAQRAALITLEPDGFTAGGFNPDAVNPDMREVHAELERAQLLLRLSQLLQPTETLEEVERLTLEALGTALGLDSLFIFLVDAGVLRVGRVWGEVPPELQPHLELGQVSLGAVPLSRLVIETREARYGCSPAPAAGIRPGTASTDMTPTHMASTDTGAVPIAGENGAVIAVLTVSRGARQGAWTGYERQLLAQAGRTLGFTFHKEALHGEPLFVTPA